ncbi:hypothetical protein LCGC14_2263760 [marine sediment metagenome]|uniref:Carboxyltransferase domain-containing protein n=1 Tax=marine sediment metagenome TaxID=412755 RepID=A0A0F9CZ57_9ZZZZ
MSRRIEIKRIGPGSSVQDMGRRGYLAQGLSRGGAADRLALLEGAALLDQPTDCAALELTAAGAVLSFDAPTRIALTGAPMPARLGDQALVWNASHAVPAGGVLTLGPVQRGVFAYLHVGGGIDRDSFVAMRTERDASLKMPRLIIPSLQVNMRAGTVPVDEAGNAVLKVPLNKL